jgi:hypothetical protein
MAGSPTRGVRLDDLWIAEFCELINEFIKESSCTAWRKLMDSERESDRVAKAGVVPQDDRFNHPLLRKRTPDQHVEVCEVHLLRQYLRLLVRSAAPNLEDTLDNYLKTAITHEGGPPLNRRAAELVIDETAVEALNVIAAPKVDTQRALAGSSLLETFRLATLAPDGAVRTGSAALRFMGTLLRNVVQQARRCMAADVALLERNRRPPLATPQNELRAVAQTVGISRALRALESAESHSTLLGTSTEKRVSLLPDTAFHDLDMLCRHFQVEIPRYEPPQGMTVANFEKSFAGELLRSSEQTKPRTASEYYDGIHKRFLFAHNMKDATALADDCLKTFASADAQTNLRGEVAPAHIGSNLKRELDSCQSEMKRLRNELLVAQRKNTLLNEEADHNARKEQIVSIRKSIFALGASRRDSSIEGRNLSVSQRPGSPGSAKVSFPDEPPSRDSISGEELAERRRRSLFPSNELDDRRRASQRSEGAMEDPHDDDTSLVKDLVQGRRLYETFLKEEQLKGLENAIEKELRWREEERAHRMESPNHRVSPLRLTSPSRRPGKETPPRPTSAALSPLSSGKKGKGKSRPNTAAQGKRQPLTLPVTGPSESLPSPPKMTLLLAPKLGPTGLFPPKSVYVRYAVD